MKKKKIKASGNKGKIKKTDKASKIKNLANLK